MTTPNRMIENRNRKSEAAYARRKIDQLSRFAMSYATPRTNPDTNDEWDAFYVALQEALDKLANIDTAEDNIK